MVQGRVGLNCFSPRSVWDGSWTEKHLRAERILDPDYENKTYGIDSLVRAILKRQVYPRGVFVRAL